MQITDILETMDGGYKRVFPLQQWMTLVSDQCVGRDASANYQHCLLLGKTSVAYGIAELLKHLRDHPGNTKTASLAALYRIDNFTVRTEATESLKNEVIVGVDMLSPKISVNMIEPPFLIDNEKDTLGRYLEVEFSSSLDDYTNDEKDPGFTFLTDAQNFDDHLSLASFSCSSTAVDLDVKERRTNDEVTVLVGSGVASASAASSVNQNEKDTLGSCLEVEFLSSLNDYTNDEKDPGFTLLSDAQIDDQLSFTSVSCSSTAVELDAKERRTNDEVTVLAGGGVASASASSSSLNQNEEDHCCHLLGVMLYGLFTNHSPLPAGAMRSNRFHADNNIGREASLEPASKKSQLVDFRALNLSDGARHNNSKSALQASVYVTLLEKGIPSLLCLLIQNLLECGEENQSDSAYISLENLIKDLHLLLLDPSIFLFHTEYTISTAGIVSFSFREHKLYGSEYEKSQITDAFCRVSRGKSESLFIGGFSGSGKSKLVDSLTDRVGANGGYILKHKFDQISNRTILGILAVFNDLWMLVNEMSSSQEIIVIYNDLVEVFGPELLMLARLLPNIKAFVQELKLNTHDYEQESANQMNLQSICFTLQHFVRAVSSAAHPVVLFLDDLQWCDKSALTVVQSLLCDALSRIFFVGTYRSNEVADDHELFRFAERLKSSGVDTTMLSLEGLIPNDLNAMISEVLCVLPRISEPLSDIVFRKTEGNPFFVLEFLQSLADRRLLEYSVSKRRWVWDEDDISSMNITGNVLYLLSSKMNGLSENTQSVIKSVACFGIGIKE